MVRAQCAALRGGLRAVDQPRSELPPLRLSEDDFDPEVAYGLRCWVFSGRYSGEGEYVPTYPGLSGSGTTRSGSRKIGYVNGLRFMIASIFRLGLAQHEVFRRCPIGGDELLVAHVVLAGGHGLADGARHARPAFGRYTVFCSGPMG